MRHFDPRPSRGMRLLRKSYKARRHIASALRWLSHYMLYFQESLFLVASSPRIRIGTMASMDWRSLFYPQAGLMLQLTAIAFVLVVAYLVYVRQGTPLRKVPGPFLASISKAWIVKKQLGLQRPLVDLELHRRYGSVVRVAPDEVLISSPKAKKTIYGE